MSTKPAESLATPSNAFEQSDVCKRSGTSPNVQRVVAKDGLHALLGNALRRVSKVDKKRAREAARQKYSHDGGGDGEMVMGFTDDGDEMGARESTGGGKDKRRRTGRVCPMWDMPNVKGMKTGIWADDETEALERALAAIATECGIPDEELWTEWMFNRKGQKHSGGAKGMWYRIHKDYIPHRKPRHIYDRAKALVFKKAYKQGSWTAEEDAKLTELISQWGYQWRKISAELSRSHPSCKYRWRWIQQGLPKTNRWSEQESQKLQEIVLEYLWLVDDVMRGREEHSERLQLEYFTLEEVADSLKRKLSYKSDDRQVRDDINWDLIASKMETRNERQCLREWYTSSMPSMVECGQWGKGEDKWLLASLYFAGESQESDVCWDDLVPGRTASQCQKRWRLMCKALHGGRNVEFTSKVETLLESFVPRLASLIKELESTPGVSFQAGALPQEVETFLRRRHRRPAPRARSEVAPEDGDSNRPPNAADREPVGDVPGRGALRDEDSGKLGRENLEIKEKGKKRKKEKKKRKREKTGNGIKAKLEKGTQGEKRKKGKKRRKREEQEEDTSIPMTNATIKKMAKREKDIKAKTETRDKLKNESRNRKEEKRVEVRTQERGE